MKRLQYVAVLPHPKWGIEPEYVGPFDTLSEAMKWGKAHGCPDYKTITPPERWERMHAHDDDFISANADAMREPLVDVLHDEAYIEQAVQEYAADHEQYKVGLTLVPPNMESAFREEAREGMVRCKNARCGVMLSPEPMLEEWGFCSSECEREYGEDRQ